MVRRTTSNNWERRKGSDRKDVSTKWANEGEFLRLRMINIDKVRTRSDIGILLQVSRL
jgi:hypothetical protein